jgi:hypothetical protein
MTSQHLDLQHMRVRHRGAPTVFGDIHASQEEAARRAEVTAADSYNNSLLPTNKIKKT